MKFFLSTIWWLDVLKRIAKIIRENAFEQEDWNLLASTIIPAAYEHWLGPEL